MGMRSGLALNKVQVKCLWTFNSPNFKASDLGMFVVAVGRVMGVAAAVLAARLWMET